MMILENLKQFCFASVLFLTAVSIHWSFVGQTTNQNSMAQQKQSKTLEHKESAQTLAYSNGVKNVNL